MDELTVNRQAAALSANVFSNSEDFQELFNIGKMFASSSLVPQNYQGKPMDCAIAVDMANRMGVSPMMVMQNLHVVKGKPQWSGQAYLSMIRSSAEFKNVRPVYTGEKGTDSWGCYIQAEYRGSGEIVRGTEVTIRMAKAEEWYQKTGSKWKTMPEQMLAYRAASFFARVYIPNSLMGCQVEGEAEDISQEERDRPQDPFAGPDIDEIPASILAETEEVFR